MPTRYISSQLANLRERKEGRKEYSEALLCFSRSSIKSSHGGELLDRRTNRLKEHMESKSTRMTRRTSKLWRRQRSTEGRNLFSAMDVIWIDGE